jgi:formate--tetrahydrofolate ligase
MLLTADTLIQPLPISEIAARLGLGPDDVEPWGWSKAKCALGLERRLADRPLGKYVGVTAVTPTPLGEGKTVVAIGLAMALCRLGKRAIAALREPSLAPVFGLKGGGAGGGRASLVPADDINLHFTGDLHAVTAANNLLAALIDNHVRRRLTPVVDPASVTWRRAIDVSDKGLAHIVTGLGAPVQAPLRETGFDLTAASEVMAILALAADLADLRARLGRIVVGMTPEWAPVTAEDLHAAGALAALLRDAIRPNVVQTCEGTPAFVHAGPFANIAHGNSSVIADRIALRLADFVVTESGFGADCGSEKFFDIKCRVGGLTPAAEVLVCTVRALKLHAGRVRMVPGKPLPSGLLAEDLQAVRDGGVNLQANLDLLRRFGVPVVVAVNRFPHDTERELNLVRELALEYGAQSAAVVEAFALGSAGALELAEAVVDACTAPSRLEYAYPLELPLEQKFEKVATQVYGADGVDFAPHVSRRLQEFVRLGYGGLPVCIAKTQYSLSHDSALLGRPTGFRVPINDVRLSAGAGFVYGLAGDVVTMPGLPSHPAARHIDVDAEGQVHGIL